MTFTATVIAYGGVIPPGSVDFDVNGVDKGTVPLDGTGKASKSGSRPLCGDQHHRGVLHPERSVGVPAQQLVAYLYLQRGPGAAAVRGE